MPRKAAGFTLLEIILSLALLSIVLGLGLYISVGSFRSTVARSQVSTVVSSLQSARESAMNTIDEKPWSAYGVTFSQLSGTTTPTTLSILENGRTSTISINNEGQIDW